MKSFFLNFLKFILKFEASLFLRKNKNIEIIAITGSVGKTTTKEAIFTVLKDKFSVIKNEGTLNNEYGVPLTVLQLPYQPSFVGYLKNIFNGKITALFKKAPYKIAVLEMGADKPNDLQYLTSFVKPHISVITAVAPVHLQQFGSLEEVEKEKRRLVEVLEKNDWAILNFDDKKVRKFSEVTDAKVIYFGLDEHADVHASDYQLAGWEENDAEKIFSTFKINYMGNVVPIKIKIFGRHQIYGILAAVCVGIIYGLDLVSIIESLSRFKPYRHRMEVKNGIKKSIIIDDSYNSSPLAVTAALDFLKEFEGRRKIAVLADMLELGFLEEEAHKEAGKEAMEKSDIFIAVGERMKTAFNLVQKLWGPERVYWAKDSRQAADLIESLIREGDVVLVKGSRKMAMEKVVEKISINTN